MRKKLRLSAAMVSMLGVGIGCLTLFKIGWLYRPNGIDPIGWASDVEKYAPMALAGFALWLMGCLILWFLPYRKDCVQDQSYRSA